ncbi:MAG: MBOAT family protein [Peptococcaceae bacterium]|nr:MBOAT family protein [Peptococcaceae bacterium]
MIFPSIVFLMFFLPFVLVVYYGFLRSTRKRNLFLLMASLFFYAWGEPVFVWLMAVSICWNYGIGRLLGRYQRIGRPKTEKFWLWLGVLGSLACLFLFKYMGFVVENVNEIFNLSWSVPVPSLPIGISFFTFQALSYLVDVYRREVPTQRSLIDLGLYISFFPQLVAGPIVRYQSIAAQIKFRQENWADFSVGFSRFLCGLGKKVLIANQAAVVADKAFNMPAAELTIGFAWLGMVAYSLQIFFDFAGYSDMAIGLGKMFGFSFAENFHYPYMAVSVTDFWRRWHISLSSWFRDYVYIPLGGSRVATWRCYVNLWIVWLCTGIWHGADWSFLLWGMWHFMFLMSEKVFHIERKVPVLFYRAWVLLIVGIGWVFFRSADLSASLLYLRTMFGLSGVGAWNDTMWLYLREYWFYLGLGLVFSINIVSWGKVKLTNSLCWQRGLLILQPAAYSLLLLLVLSFLAKAQYNPFIYFNF